MTAPMHTARFILTVLAIALLDMWVLIRYTRSCRCDWCTAPFALWARGDRQFCRRCKQIFDRHSKTIGRRRSLLRRIWRSAA